MSDLKTYEVLTESFEAGTLEASGFSHVDHIGVACQLLQKHDFLDAAARYGRALRTLAAGAGVPEKFNTTITLSFLGILSERMADTPHDSFGEFLQKNPDLLSRALMSRWYSDARITSPDARTRFLLPDRFQA
ncbi:hypothetical protein [Roseibium sp. M-1]